MKEIIARKSFYPILIVSILVYLIGGYVIASISEQSGFGFFVVTVGFGLFGLVIALSLLQKKFRTIWYGLAGASLGIITGLLVGHAEKAVEWGITYFMLGNLIGFASYFGWIGIIIGAGIGCAIALLAGTRMSFADHLKISNPALHILVSILTGILIGGFWGGAFQMAFANLKKKE